MIYDLQKASIMKRISAFLLDFIIMTMCVTGLMLITSNIVNYDGYIGALEERLTSIQEKYSIAELEQTHGVTFNEFQYMLEDEISTLPEELSSVFIACNEEMNTDEQSIRLYETIMTLSLMIISISVLVSFVIFEFVIPLIFKNGQTIGKKIFSIAVMRVDGVKIPASVLFIRSILGKYTIGVMVPILMLLSLLFGSVPLIPLAIILLILLIQLVLIIVTKTNSLIHDVLASTVVVDLQSQMIFDSVEALNEYKLRIHKENADKTQY